MDVLHDLTLSERGESSHKSRIPADNLSEGRKGILVDIEHFVYDTPLAWKSRVDKVSANSRKEDPGV